MKTEIENIIKKYSKSSPVNIIIKEEYKGFSFNEDDPIIKLAGLAINDIGLKPDYQVSGGGSHTNIYNSCGISAVTIAVGMQNPHTKEEYVEIADLVNTTRLIIRIAEIA